MQERSKPELLHYLCVVDVPLVKQGFAGKTGDVHGAKRVLKAGMLRARVNEVRAGKLPYPAQPLERGAVDDLLFHLREPDVLVHRVGDLASKVH